LERRLREPKIAARWKAVERERQRRFHEALSRLGFHVPRRGEDETA
jgi:hypothetical protein